MCGFLVAVQVGNLWDGAGLTASADGSSTGMRLDNIIRLSGVNNIVGRALIVHGNGTLSTAGKAARVAQCVIGDAAGVRATDCVYSEWGGWGNCACGAGASVGTRTRTRTQLSGPTNGGAECTTFTESQECHTCTLLDCQLVHVWWPGMHC